MLFYKLIPVLIILVVFIINIIIGRKTPRFHLRYPALSILIIKILLFFTYSYFFGFSFDINSYFEHSQLIMNGHIPLVDYLSPYSLGFEYLMALPTIVHQFPYMIAIFFLIVESCIYLLLEKMGVSSKNIALIAFNPVIFHFTVIDTQDEILMCLFVVGAVYSLKSQMPGYKNILISFCALFFTKILTIVAIFPLYIKNKRNGVYLLLLCLAAYFILYISGFNIFSMAFSRTDSSDEIMEIITSGNLIWILTQFKLINVKLVQLIAPISLIIVNLAVLYFYKSTDKVKAYLVIVIINFLTLLIAYKMSFSYYYIVPVVGVYLLSLHLKKGLNYGFLIFSLIISVNQNLYFIENSENTGAFFMNCYLALQIALVVYVLYIICSLMRLLGDEKVELKQKEATLLATSFFIF